MSLFNMLSIGARGLSAAQTELDLVGQNVTNANTEGYTRKTANLQSDTRMDGNFGQIGYGVDVVNIKRIRDDLLDRQMQQVQTQQGERKQLDSDLQSVQNVLTEPADSGLNTFLDKFWSSWQDLANNPSDVTARQAVSDSASSLVGRFQSASSQFDQLVVTKNDEIAASIDKVNGLIKGIASDNQTISESEAGGLRANANDTRDQRETKLRELSQLMDVSYVTDPQGRYIINSGGGLLVSPSGDFPLKVNRTMFTLSDGTQVSQAGVAFSNNSQEFTPKSGSLKALFDTRDQVIPKYQSQLDTLAKTLVQAVNAQHEQGYDLSGTTGSDFFDPKTTGAANIDLAANIKAGPESIAAAFGGTSQGLGAPLALTSPVAGTPLDIANTVNTQYRNFVKGSVVVSTVGPPATVLSEGAGKDYSVDYQGGTLVFNNTSSVPPGTAITVDFRYVAVGYNGQGDGNNALKIAQIAQQKNSSPDKFGVNTATLGDTYASLVGNLGAEKANAATTLTTTNNLNDYLQKQIDGISGVSMDEELGNMVKFQNSYQASARYISTVSKLMDTLIGL